ncbi:MAG: hypothetical protein PUP93_21310 [Rhizonema sp. NSF051]|nr:hypothetical protein [Rhizonema sp. NSF051]
MQPVKMVGVFTPHGTSRLGLLERILYNVETLMPSLYKGFGGRSVSIGRSLRQVQNLSLLSTQIKAFLS